MIAVVTLGVLALAGYTLWVLVYPNRPCPTRRCVGGKLYQPNGVGWHWHRRCDRTGHIRKFRWWAPFASRKLPQ